jgi:hypothetical protein
MRRLLRRRSSGRRWARRRGGRPRPSRRATAGSSSLGRAGPTRCRSPPEPGRTRGTTLWPPVSQERRQRLAHQAARAADGHAPRPRVGRLRRGGVRCRRQASRWARVAPGGGPARVARPRRTVRYNGAMSGWAIDLGTTNTGVARWDDDAERPRLVELPRVCRRPGGEDHLQAPRMVPSAVELAAPRGVWARMLAGQVLGRVFLGGDGALIGRMALERSEGERRPGFVPSFKRWLARDALHVAGERWRPELDRPRGRARVLAPAPGRGAARDGRAHSGPGASPRRWTPTSRTAPSCRASRGGWACGGCAFSTSRWPLRSATTSARARRGACWSSTSAPAPWTWPSWLLTPKGTLAGTCDVLAKEGRRIGGNDVDRWLLEDFCRRLDYPLREDDGSEEGRFWYRLMLDEARRVKEALFFAEDASFDLTPPEELRRFEAVVRGATTELAVTPRRGHGAADGAWPRRRARRLPGRGARAGGRAGRAGRGHRRRADGGGLDAAARDLRADRGALRARPGAGVEAVRGGGVGRGDLRGGQAPARRWAR